MLRLLYISLLFLVFVTNGQVMRGGRLQFLKKSINDPSLRSVDSPSLPVVQLPKLDNCALMLQNLLQEKGRSKYFNIGVNPLRNSLEHKGTGDYLEDIEVSGIGNRPKSLRMLESSLVKNVPSPSDDDDGDEDKDKDKDKHSDSETNAFADNLNAELRGGAPIHSGSFAFGRGITVDIDVVARGTWYTLSNGMGRILKLGIKSPTAFSLNLLFDKFWLPDGGELYIHGQTAMLGAYTAAVNNKKHMKFATTPLPGSFLLVEYFSPNFVKKDPILHIFSVVHGFRPMPAYHLPNRAECEAISQTISSHFSDEEESESFHEQAVEYLDGIKAGACNINAPACPECSQFLDQAKSVAIVMTSNGQKFCTGSMINNGRQNGRQLFLTADHCVNEFNSDFRYNILGFNYQSKLCQNNPNEWPLVQTTQGLKLLGKWEYFLSLILLARSTESDFALFEVQERIPSKYGVFMAGWSASQDPPPAPIVSIHHPSGDVKKISLVMPDASQNIRIYLDCWNECPLKHHWKISRWSKGVTEPGSSGAALFNKEGLIIGQLHGGASSCKNPNGFDIFGSLFASMYAKTSQLNSLKHWLDPDNLGTLVLKGEYLNVVRKQFAEKNYSHQQLFK